MVKKFIIKLIPTITTMIIRTIIIMMIIIIIIIRTGRRTGFIEQFISSVFVSCYACVPFPSLQIKQLHQLFSGICPYSI